jgi:hypothetical protein
MGEYREVEKCISRKPGEPYVQCDCYAHDFVAELLNVDSTRANGYKSTKSRGLSVVDANGKAITDPRKRQAAIEQAFAHPPRPRKPKEPIAGQPTIDLTEARLRPELPQPEDSDWDLLPVARKPNLDLEVAEYYERAGYGVEKIYELGKAEPVDVIYELPPYLVAAGGEFSIHGQANEATQLLYKRNGRAVRRLLPTDPDRFEQVARDMIKEMDLAEQLVETMIPLQNEWR